MSRLLQTLLAVNPEHKSEFEPQIEETDDEERPRVRACEWVKPEPTVPIEKKPTHWVPPQTNVAEAEAKATDTTLKGKLEVTIFSNLKKTEKSSKIVEYFLSNINKEVSIDDIASGTKLDKSAVNSWLAQTSKEIKAIQKCEKLQK